MKPSPHRATILDLSAAGMSNSEIAKRLKVHRSLVTKALKKGKISDKAGRERKRSVDTNQLRQKIRKRIHRETRKSMRKLAKELGTNRETVRTIVKYRLGLCSYKIGKTHFLNEKSKASRYQKARLLLQWAAANDLSRVVFSDEKVFSLEGMPNSQNDRQLLPKGMGNSPLAVTHKKSHFPASVMVWAAVTSTGKTDLIFVDKGVKIDGNYYREYILKKELLPWAHSHFAAGHWTFQQDWAPAHGAKATIALCQASIPEIFTKDLWPSNSPDLNPLDYSVWSVLESHIDRRNLTTVEDLKKALVRAWDKITPQYLAATINNLPKRLKAVRRQKGGQFENLF
ncbi:hypothetical protein B9Z55_018076 [Caenorhabditis nigoni]|uniref:Uncharacterized protein n=1 Tax=Caenorhabditis nigoni TaxID=1611254 RepID=A0A2G5TC57_9PELO|nr:hypothetical protein B9Z55_018076 [Caenorhabditis nigoni]